MSVINTNVNSLAAQNAVNVNARRQASVSMAQKTMQLDCQFHKL